MFSEEIRWQVLEPVCSTLNLQGIRQQTVEKSAFGMEAVGDGGECISKDVWRWFKMPPLMKRDGTHDVQPPPNAIRRIKSF